MGLVNVKVRLITVKPPYNAVSITSRDDFICNSDITLTTSSSCSNTQDVTSRPQEDVTRLATLVNTTYWLHRRSIFILNALKRYSQEFHYYCVES